MAVKTVEKSGFVVGEHRDYEWVMTVQTALPYGVSSPAHATSGVLSSQADPEQERRAKIIPIERYFARVEPVVVEAAQSEIYGYSEDELLP